MFEYIKKLFKFSATNGFFLPSAYDNRSKKGSVSLLFAHIANFITILGIVSLLVKDLELGVYCSIGYSGLMLAFYLLRSLDKVKLGREGIELDSDESEEENIDDKSN